MNIKKAVSAKTANAILRGLIVEGTGWVKLGGGVILLTADVWLGASVLQAAGMDAGMSWLLSLASSALQISLFQHGLAVYRRARTPGQKTNAVAVLFVGWVLVVLDSILDAMAAFVRLGNHQLPTTWTQLGGELRQPVVVIGFFFLFLLSFLGERFARLGILNEHDEDEDDEDEDDENEDDDAEVEPVHVAGGTSVPFAWTKDGPPPSRHN